MKVYIGPYKNWFGPFQLAELLCFWARKVPDEYGIPRVPGYVHRFGEILAYGLNYNSDEDHNIFAFKERDKTWLYSFLSWIESKRSRRVKIRIDSYDTWNMDRTLALIVLPMLKQLKDTKHGSALVDAEDVPEDLRVEEEQDSEINHKRWDWVMGEMIWAFEQHQPDCDWESTFTTGNIDYISVPCDFDEDGTPKLYRLEHGPNYTAVTDTEGRQKHAERIQNGFRLFGKYYQGLWD